MERDIRVMVEPAECVGFAAEARKPPEASKPREEFERVAPGGNGGASAGDPDAVSKGGDGDVVSASRKR